MIPVIYFVKDADVDVEHLSENFKFIDTIQNITNQVHFRVERIDCADIDKWNNVNWVYPLCVNMSSFRDTEVDLLNLVNERVKMKLLEGIGNLFISGILECDTICAYASIHDTIDAHGLNPDNIVYIAGGENQQECYYDWCLKNDIPFHSRISVISCNQWFAAKFDSSAMEDITKYKARPKKYTCLNRVMSRHHRILLLSMLSNYNQLATGIVSAHDDKHTDDIFNNSVLHTTMSDENRDVLTNGYATLRPELPMILDDITVPKFNFISAEMSEFYLNSYYSVITETNFSGHAIYLTEKTARALHHKHPFILLSVPGTLKMLKCMGFKTFHPVIDETYDTIEDDIERISAVTNEIIKLNKMSTNIWDSLNIGFFNDIVEHNKKVLDNIHNVYFFMFMSGLIRYYEYEQV